MSEDLQLAAHGEGARAKHFPQTDLATAIFSAVGVKLRELVSMRAPVKRTTVDNDASQGCSMASDPSRGGVQDNVDSVVDRSRAIASTTERIVRLGFLLAFGKYKDTPGPGMDNPCNSIGMSNLSYGFKIWDGVLRIANALHEKELGLFVNQIPEAFWIIEVTK